MIQETRSPELFPYQLDARRAIEFSLPVTSSTSSGFFRRAEILSRPSPSTSRNDTPSLQPA